MTLGALLADVPHTRPVPVTAHRDGPELGPTRSGSSTSRYEGPTGIVGVLQDACAAPGIPALSLWAAVPHYVAQPPCPKATLALLRRVEELLDVRIPLGDLPEDARAWERGVDELAAEDAEVGRVRHDARGGQGHRRAPRGQRRGDRAGVRALPAPPRRRAPHPRSADQALSIGATADQRSWSVVRGGCPGGRRRSRATSPGRGRVVRGRVGQRRARPRRRPRRARRACPGRRRGRSRTAASSCVAGRAAAVGAPTAARQRASRSVASARPGVGPVPVVAVVVREQGQPDRHRVDAVGAQPRRRRPGCRATSTSSRRRARPCRRARSAGRTAVARSSTSACDAPISWCGKSRSVPPPCTSNAVAEQVQRDDGALDVPARPAGAERAAVPGRLARRAAAPQQRVERVALARPLGVAAALGGQRAASSSSVQVRLVAERRGGVRRSK